MAMAPRVDFIARSNAPQSVIDFQPSEKTKAHVADLIRQFGIRALTPKEFLQAIGELP
jgi:hypothetical protein